jgi:acyl dehydratase
MRDTAVQQVIATTQLVEVRGPWFEELDIGQEFVDAPALTLTDGHAAAHQAILGDRLRLSLDATLAEAVTTRSPLAHPGLVCDVAIGQSTSATQNVRANLFYRGLVLRRLPIIGDTLRTRTVVEALRQNATRSGRAPTGLVVLRVTTVDQAERTILDFWRCAMIPLSDDSLETGRADDVNSVGTPIRDTALQGVVTEWDLGEVSSRFPGCLGFADLRVGQGWYIAGGDTVSNAPELARLTLNIAAVHHDRMAGGGRRLVYGGHTIGLALAQACRALPNLVTVIAWRRCDHLAAVHEGDTIRSVLEVERLVPLTTGGGLVELRSQVSAAGADGDSSRPVLDWSFVAVLP